MTAAHLQIGLLQPSSISAGADIALEIKMTLHGSFNFGGTAGGWIVIELPPGF